MTDALVARLTRAAGDLAASGPMGALIRGDKTLAFASDIDALLTAYATVQAERDAAMKRAEYWKAEHLAGNAELATLRETLAGELDHARESLVGCFLSCERCGEENDCSDMDAVLFIDNAIKLAKGNG